MAESPEPTVTHVNLDAVNAPAAPSSPPVVIANRFQGLCYRLAELSTEFEFLTEDLAKAGINLDQWTVATKRLEELTAG